jgi:hypothetical protein
VTLARLRVWHTLRNHYFSLYFPEIDRFVRSDHSVWLIQLLTSFPTPASITALSEEEFQTRAWNLVGRKVSKRALLAEIYAAAKQSIGVPVALDSAAIAMFRLVLEQYLSLHRLRERIAEQAAFLLEDDPDSRRLMTVPGIGPANALTILAEAGDLRRFRHHRQFLSFCGLNLPLCSRASPVVRATSPSMATPGCARPSGWPRRPRSECGRTVSAASSTTMFAAIHSMLTSGVRSTPQSLPSWRG